MKFKCIIGRHRYVAVSEWFSISGWQTRRWLECADCGKRRMVG